MALYSKRHLQEQRQGDHGATEGDLLEHLLGDTDAEVQVLEQVGVQQGGLPPALALDEPVGEQGQGDDTDGNDEADVATTLLPDQDAEDNAPHTDDGEDRTHEVDLARSRVGHVLDEADLGQDHQDDDDLKAEPDAPRQIGGDEPAEERSDGCGDRRGGTDQRVGLLLGGAREVAVDERLHGRQQE